MRRTHPRGAAAAPPARRWSSPTTTRATPPAPSSPAPSRRRPSSPWTASANGAPPRFGVGRGNRIELTARDRSFPHSLGLLYSAFTYYCGFKVNSGEYKLMGLAPYGQPVYQDAILKHLIDLKPDGSFWLEHELLQLLPGPDDDQPAVSPRSSAARRGSRSRDLEQRHMDLAASIQAVTEEIMLRIGRAPPRADRHEEPRAGRRRGPELRGQRPAPARGAVRRPLDPAGRRRRRRRAGRGPVRLAPAPRASRASRAGRDAQQGSLLGPRFPTTTIAQFLHRAEAAHRQRFDDEAELLEHVAALLADGQGRRLVPGPHGVRPARWAARSILGDPRSPTMQATMNLKIKFRESFRPFAPIVLSEHAHEWFDARAGQESPYMLLVAVDSGHKPCSRKSAPTPARSWAICAPTGCICRRLMPTSQKRYPVIYWLHGYERSSEQADYGRSIAAYVGAHDVIVADTGPIETTGEFPLYLPELVEHLDRRCGPSPTATIAA